MKRREFLAAAAVLAGTPRLSAQPATPIRAKASTLDRIAIMTLNFQQLATAIRFPEGELEYKGLYTIEASNGHEGTHQIYDVVVATL